MWPKPAHQDELQKRWMALGKSLGITSLEFDTEGQRLIRSWARWPRKYHNTPHLLACLRHFAQVQDQMRDPVAVELALWFHDAIYWPWLSKNEEKSANWAVQFIQKMGLSPTLAQQVEQHILDTKHQAIPSFGDAQWVVDIDLAVLGQGNDVYQQFEKNVRSEYRWVRWSRYVKGRSAVLNSFLDRPRIYNTPWFFERYEISARANLHQAITALSAG